MGGSQVSRKVMFFFVPKEYDFPKEKEDAVQNLEDKGREVQSDEPARNKSEINE